MAASLTKTLNALENGEFNCRASDLLEQLTLAVRETGKTGSLTIAISMKPVQGHRGAMALSVKASLKTPEIPPQAIVLFATDDGELLLNDPRQMQIPMQTVEAQPLKLKINE